MTDKRYVHISWIVVLAIVLPLVALLATALPAGATTGLPNGTIVINTYGAFYNVWEQGDVMFVASYDIPYIAPPAGSAAQYFQLIIYNVDGTTPLGYQGVIDFNYKLVTVYFTAGEAVGAGMVISAHPKYVFKIVGIPIPFALPVPASDAKTLDDASYWFDCTSSKDSLRTRIISIVGAIQDADVVYYGDAVYLTTDANSNPILATMPTVPNSSGWSGQSMVLAATPNLPLNIVIPSMFQSSIQSLTPWTAVGTGAYQGNLTMVSKMGAQFTAAFVGLGTTFGISTEWAAGLFWSLIMVTAAMIVFAYSGSGLAGMILVFPLMMTGNYLGLIPLVLTFTLTILLVIYVGYHIYLRGLV